MYFKGYRQRSTDERHTTITTASQARRYGLTPAQHDYIAIDLARRDLRLADEDEPGWYVITRLGAEGDPCKVWATDEIETIDVEGCDCDTECPECV